MEPAPTRALQQRARPVRSTLHQARTLLSPYAAGSATTRLVPYAPTYARPSI